jgi:hypothetical protein
LTPDLAQAWTREALRLYGRYQVEIVEALGLCPWASRTRLDGELAVEVILDHGELALSRSLDVIAELAGRTRVDVGILVYPRMRVARDAFDAFVGRVRAVDAERHPPGHIPFMSAAFHPDAEPDAGDPERLIPFLRRTPDATVQLVRASVVDQVRSRAPQGTQLVDIEAIEAGVLAGEEMVPLRTRIARSNLATTLELGVAHVRSRLDDIKRDRDETYASLVKASA